MNLLPAKGDLCPKTFVGLIPIVKELNLIYALEIMVYSLPSLVLFSTIYAISMIYAGMI
jgi:hypothetical protein